jgi:hypothetical protein
MCSSSSKAEPCLFRRRAGPKEPVPSRSGRHGYPEGYRCALPGHADGILAQPPSTQG